MSDDHERFQQLAVGHVLGGLDPTDAAAFRSHLLGCRDCRARVAELRGIASDLERAERDERARSVVRTELEPATRRAPADAPSAHEPLAARPRIGVGHVSVAAVVVLLLAGAMAFWNLHLRSTNAVVTSVAEQRGQALTLLASGISVPVESRHPVRGVAAVDGDQVAVALTGIGGQREGRLLVVWLHHDGGYEVVARVPGDRLEDGDLALTAEDGDADVLLVTAEANPPDDSSGAVPRGPRLARVELAPAEP